jgi:Tol biopolymer transport system component
MFFFSRPLLAVGLSALLIAINPYTTSSAKTKTGLERIIYLTFQPGNWDIYYFPKRGEAPRRLTDDPDLEYGAVISPDERWLVYCSEQRGNADLYALDLKNGGRPRLLLESEAMEDQAAISRDGKTLAFVSTRDGNADVFTIPFRPEKTQNINNAINLTHHPGGDFRPSFSPDGKLIAFSSDRDTAPTGDPAARRRAGEIYVMDIHGQNLRRLTFQPGWDGSPAWSLDGREIYFYSGRDRRYRIWVMNQDGSSPRVISPKTNDVALSPTVMPDGRIAYSARTGPEETARWRIMSVKPDGSDERVESEESNNYWQPSFGAKTGAMFCHGVGPTPKDAPVGSVFPGRMYLGPGPLLRSGYPKRTDLPDRKVELYPIRGFSAVPHPNKDLLVRTELPQLHLELSNLRGDSAKQLTAVQNGELPWIGLSWSRDGDSIAYTAGEMFSPPKAEADVWKIRSDGTGAVNLTLNSPGNDGFPSFSGDGRRIVFRSGRTGNFDIFLMNADGTGVTNLTNNPADDTFPAFSPLNDEVAFSSNRDGLLDPKTKNRTFDIYTMKVSADGKPGEVRRLTYTNSQNAHPQYSPDGQWLIFTSEQAGIDDEEPLINQVIFSPQIYGELYLCRLKDGKLFRLTNNKWEDGFPSWVLPVN